MSLRDEIQEAQKQAMKERKEKTLSTLRLLWSQIRNTEIDKKGDLTDSEILDVVKRQVKQLKDSLKDFERGGRQDLITGVNEEVGLLESYLPAQMGDEDLKKITEEVLQKNNITETKDMGKAIGLVMKEINGGADGNRVRELISQILK
ncbi:MAG TPA: aspartyl-tRNA amidotransferase [Candidatus Magasanikbacteria bacterium]|nr:aspartyl-tRNA amidotransferase [Candidatus Magasanikbacteria bacterium]